MWSAPLIENALLLSGRLVRANVVLGKTREGRIRSLAMRSFAAVINSILDSVADLPRGN